MTIVCVALIMACQSTQQLVNNDGIDFSKDSLSQKQMAQWIKQNSLKCAQLVSAQRETKQFSIPSDMIKDDPCLVYLVLNSESMKQDKDQQSWFDLYSQMNQDQKNRLYDILYRERHKVLTMKESDLLNSEAYAFAEKKDYDNAIKTIDKAIKKYPKEANLYDSKGEFLLMKGDNKGALKMWNKVLELDPDFLSTYKTTELYEGLKKLQLIQ